jgi:pyruvate/2-oxoglutarate dehydrogenase complex dihydrolipoamide acyltransferase (E2) component
MRVEILMPELGESVHEGTVSRWLKQVGDTVKEDEPVVEIMTDKVNTELGAPSAGVLAEIVIGEGAPVKVFEAMGFIETDASVAVSAPCREERRTQSRSGCSCASRSTNHDRTASFWREAMVYAVGPSNCEG